MNAPNIMINNNNNNIITNQKFKKPPKRLFFTTKQEITVLVVCILSFFSQMGVYYCLSKVEYNGILIAFVGSVITWTISIPFIISSFEKFRYQKYFHLTYMIIEIFLVIAAGVRFTQYSCYTSVFRTLGMKTTDPLNNMKYQYIKEGLPNWVELYTFTFIGTIFLCIWLYCIRTSYNLYRRINIIRMYEDNKLGNNKIVSQKETPNFQNIMGNNNNSQNIFPISAPIYNPQITPYITNQQFPKT